MHLDFAHLNLSHIFLQRNFFPLFEILELGFICLSAQFSTWSGLAVSLSIKCIMNSRISLSTSHAWRQCAHLVATTIYLGVKFLRRWRLLRVQEIEQINLDWLKFISHHSWLFSSDAGIFVFLLQPSNVSRLSQFKYHPTRWELQCKGRVFHFSSSKFKNLSLWFH